MSAIIRCLDSAGTSGHHRPNARRMVPSVTFIPVTFALFTQLKQPNTVCQENWDQYPQSTNENCYSREGQKLPVKKGTRGKMTSIRGVFF